MGWGCGFGVLGLGGAPGPVMSEGWGGGGVTWGENGKNIEGKNAFGRNNCK